MTLRILITGAAGLIGGELAARLAARGHRVSALVHRDPEVRGNDGARPVLHATLHGDVSRSRFGWDEAVFETVAADHDLLIHCAATTRFDLEPEAYRAVNVDAAHAIALARAGGVALLHVSTAYVCGDRDGVITEDDPRPEAGFANAYEASKAHGESLVEASGLVYAIARPSVVVGEHRSGAIRTLNTIYAAFKLIALGRVHHMAASPHATIDFVPIDYVAAGLATLAETMTAASGGRYHLVSGQPVPVAAFAAAIGAFPQFSAPILVAPEDFVLAALPPLERRLYARVAGLYSTYFQRSPQFDDARFRALTGLACPPTGPAYLARLIEHCIAVGFLPDGGRQAAAD